MTIASTERQSTAAAPSGAAPPPPGAVAPSGFRRWFRTALPTIVLMLPAAAALSLLFFYPLARIAITSVTEPEPGLGNYIDMFTDGYTVAILLRTVWVSFVVAVVTIILAFPVAYAMTICKPLTRAILFTIVLIPFWTSGTAKNFVFLALFQRNGVIDGFLSQFGIDYPLVGTAEGVTIAMAQ